jgi:hypothetical protein
MRNWYHVEARRHIAPFVLVLEWCYEDSALRDCYDEAVFDIADMVDRCNRYVDTHYIARVRVLYDGVEMGSTTLGSCYARDCDPADHMRGGLDGYLEDMIAEVLDQARARCAEMLTRLQQDFLSLDTHTA